MHTAEAGNVGIRRARGRFVTPKASDTYFSPEVIAMIARRNLDADTMYRITRHESQSTTSPSSISTTSAARQADVASLKSACLIRQMPFWELRDLHTNACGDFTLMSAAHWHLLRGHPRDTTVLSLDIDSLVMHAAAAQGVHECRWPNSCRVFKPSHGKISDRPGQADLASLATPARQVPVGKDQRRPRPTAPAHGSTTRVGRCAASTPLLGPSIERNFVRPASRWARGARPVPTQPENWGLADAPLEQRVLCRAKWDTESSASLVLHDA